MLDFFEGEIYVPCMFLAVQGTNPANFPARRMVMSPANVLLFRAILLFSFLSFNILASDNSDDQDNLEQIHADGQERENSLCRKHTRETFDSFVRIFSENISEINANESNLLVVKCGEWESEIGDLKEVQKLATEHIVKELAKLNLALKEISFETIVSKEYRSSGSYYSGGYSSYGGYSSGTWQSYPATAHDCYSVAVIFTVSHITH